MKRYTLLIILSFLSISGVRAYTSDMNSLSGSVYTAEQATVPDVSLEFKMMDVTVKGFLISSGGNYQVQLGAFRLKSNAEAFIKKVREFVDNDAVIINEDGYYKVRIPGINTEKPPDHAGNDTVQISSVVSDTVIADTVISHTEDIIVKAKTGVHDILFLKGDSPWLRRITYMGKSLTFINALIIMIVVSTASMIILLIIILLNRRRMEKEERLHQYLLEKFQSLIIDYLFGSTTPDDFRPLASDTYRRQVLIDQMIDVSINLKGEEAKKLLSLYKHLGLDRDSITRANDRRWHKKIKGFRELAFMNIKDANGTIYRALNSPNEILRMEAQIALVRLSDENPFEFLSHLTRPFSLWEQITLHELLIQHGIPVPEFKKWLSSPNPTVVMFALRMIREFKQVDAEEDVHDTILHTSPAVRQLAIQVAGDLNMRSTLDTMKHMYKNQEYNICLEIIKSMGKMPDLSMMGFLKLVLDKEDDVQLQIEATKAIENNGEEGVKALVKIMKSEYKNYNIIVRHVLDRRIF